MSPVSEVTWVTVVLNDNTVGRVVVIHSPGAEPIQIASSAHAALDDATFMVADEPFTVDEIKAWRS